MSRISLFQKIAFWSLIPSMLLVPNWLDKSLPCPGDPEGCWAQAFLRLILVPALFVFHCILFAAVCFSRNDCSVVTSGNCHAGRRFSIVLMVYYATFAVLTRCLHWLFGHYYWEHPAMGIRSWMLGGALALLAISLLFLAFYETLQEEGYEQVASITRTDAQCERSNRPH